MRDPENSDDTFPAKDRRAAVRLREDLLAMFVVHPHCAQVLRARVRNLSEGGACIFGGAQLAAGAEISVGFFLRDHPDPLVAMARVVWSRPEPDGHVAGLVFAEGAAAQRLAMRRLAEYLDGRPPGNVPG